MVSAFILVNCRYPFDVRIADAISELSFVSNIYKTEVRYDLSIKLNAGSEDELGERISSDINTIGESTLQSHYALREKDDRIASEREIIPARDLLFP
jgi:DNA-binding Lrp family transcriptional regulator